MSAAPNDAGNNGDDQNKSNTEKTVAKTAGLFVFSGIAMSILKALNPYNNNQNNNNNTIKSSVESVSVSPPPLQSKALPPPSQEPVKKSVSGLNKPSSSSLSSSSIEIVKGDTLWGLSRKYGVSIDALKEANGLTGDTIYAGKKLVAGINIQHLTPCELQLVFPNGDVAPPDASIPIVASDGEVFSFPKCALYQGVTTVV